jgi:hypothetical protein
MYVDSSFKNYVHGAIRKSTKRCTLIHLCKSGELIPEMWLGCRENSLQVNQHWRSIQAEGRQRVKLREEGR